MYTKVLNQIKNAQAVKKENVKVPYSKMDMEILDILSKKGFVDSVSKKGRLPQRVIDIKLKYENDRPGMTDYRLISKPSRALYMCYQDIKPVKNGFGIGVITTPKGIMTTGNAKKEKVGGKVLFEIW